MSMCYAKVSLGTNTWKTHESFKSWINCTLHNLRDSITINKSQAI